MNTKIQSLILDFDGTTADTRSSIINTIEYTMKVMGLEIPNKELIQNHIGLTLKDTFTEVCKIPINQIPNAIEIYRSKYDDIALKKVRLYPNVYATLKLLYKDLKISIASSKGKKSLTKLLNELNVNQFISHIIGEQDVINKKPSPDMVLKISDLTKINPLNTLVVGDTIYDVKMGKAANALSCGVTYGNHNIEKIMSANPDFIISDFGEIINILKDVV